MTPKELYENFKDAFYSGSLETENVCIELIQQAKSEWCKEQRVNCLSAYKAKRAENLIKILKDEEIIVMMD